MRSKLLALALLVLPGCATDSTWIPPMRATYDAVADEYADYVRGDPYLSREQQQRRLETVRAWDTFLTQAELEADEELAPLD